MGEERVLAVYIAILVAISLLAVVFVPRLLTRTGPVYADYSATLYSNLTLVEEYTYHVGEKGKTMLYRYWKAPLQVGYVSPPMSKPHIVLVGIECPAGSIPYAKDYRGQAYVPASGSPRDWSKEILALALNMVVEKAYDNEAGCYFPQGIPLGSHRVKFIFQLYPPVEVDEKYAHVNIKLADDHIPYRSMEVRLEELEPVKLYVHVPDYTVENKGDTIVVSGFSPKNTLIEVELVVPRSLLEENTNRLYKRNIGDVV